MTILRSIFLKNVHFSNIYSRMQFFSENSQHLIRKNFPQLLYLRFPDRTLGLKVINSLNSIEN